MQRRRDLVLQDAGPRSGAHRDHGQRGVPRADRHADPARLPRRGRRRPESLRRAGARDPDEARRPARRHSGDRRLPRVRRGRLHHRAGDVRIGRPHHGGLSKKRIEPRRPQGYIDGMEAVLQKAKTYLDGRKGERVTLTELAQAVGASPFHLQRRFKETFGVSPRDYQDAHRVQSVKSSLQNGSRVADAVFKAGYGSVSRFYEKPHLGMQARAYRARGKGLPIRYSSFATTLGTVLVGSTE